jgi:hypothetical protein
MIRLAVFLLIFSSSVHVTFAQETEKFLLPIYLRGAVTGAYESSWVSEVHMLNTGSSPATIENYGVLCPFDPCFPASIPPGLSIPLTSVRDLPAGKANPGALLFLKPEHAGQFAFQLRVRDTSRSEESWGTSLPVVHESDSRPVQHLLNVPVEAGFRQMLRVYSIPENPSVRHSHAVHVRIYGSSEAAFPYPETPDPLLAEVDLLLTAGETSSQPTYGELPGLSAIPGMAGWDLVRLELVSTERPIWAMVSVTNNVTQEVTIITPNQL